MASNFQFCSDSDSDESLSQNELEVTNPTAQTKDDEPNPYWFEYTDDEEGDSRDTEKKDKKLELIFETFDTYEHEVLSKNFVDALKAFKDFSSKAKAFFDKQPDLKKIIDVNTTDSEERSIWSVVNESVGDDEVLDTAEKKNNYLNSLINARNEFKAYLLELTEKVKRTTADEEQQEGAVDENSILRDLHALWSGKRVKVNLSRLQKEAQEKGFKTAVINVKIIQALQNLREEARRNVFVPFGDLSRSADILVGVIRSIICDQLAVEDSFDKLVLQSDDEKIEQMYKTDVLVLPDGLSGVCQTLVGHVHRSMKYTSLHSETYAKLLNLENELCDVVDLCLSKLTDKKQATSQLIKLLLVTVGQRTPAAHLYMMNRLGSSREWFILTRDIAETVEKLEKRANPDDALFAYLCTVYQVALAGNFQQGKDMILRSPLLDNRGLWKSDASQLFNRVTAMLGLAAFAAGRFYECAESLTRIFADQNSKERTHGTPDILLSIGQGEALQKELSPNEKLAIKDRGVPPHLHIQFTHLELAFYLSSLMLDCVAESRRPYHRLNQSVVTRQLSTYQEKNLILFGAPNSTKEVLIAVSNALKQGNCRDAIKTLERAEAWLDFPGFGTGDAKHVRAKVTAKVKEDALRVFLYTSACSFSTLSLDHLTQRFDMPRPEAKCVINQALVDKESPLVAFWDENEMFLHVDRGNVTRLQHLVDNAAAKVSDLWGMTNGFQTGRGRGLGRGRGRGRGR